MKSGSRYSRKTSQLAKSRPSSAASAWTRAPTELGRKEEEVPATKDVAEIVADLLHIDAETETRPSAAMVLQCLEVVLMKLDCESPARLAAQLDRLLPPVVTSAADEIQVGKQHRPRLLNEVEELQCRLQGIRRALDAARRRRSEQDVQHHRRTEHSNRKLEEGQKKRDEEEEQLRLETEVYQLSQKKSIEVAERKSKEQWTQRELLFQETEALTKDLSRIRKEYEQEKKALRELNAEVAELTHKLDVAKLQIADLGEMADRQGALEAKRAELQDEMQILLGQGARRSRRRAGKSSKSSIKLRNTVKLVKPS